MGTLSLHHSNTNKANLWQGRTGFGVITVDLGFAVISSFFFFFWSLFHLITGEGNGNPLQYFCLENHRDRGAWQATVHGVAKTQPLLKQISTHFIWYKYSTPIFLWFLFVCNIYFHHFTWSLCLYIWGEALTSNM